MCLSHWLYMYICSLVQIIYNIYPHAVVQKHVFSWDKKNVVQKQADIVTVVDYYTIN